MCVKCVVQEDKKFEHIDLYEYKKFEHIDLMVADNNISTGEQSLTPFFPSKSSPNSCLLDSKSLSCYIFVMFNCTTNNERK